jgi:cytoskeletal protein RodZ
MPKTNCGVDIVAQDRAARLLVAGEHEFDRFAKQAPCEIAAPVGRVHGSFHENLWSVASCSFLSLPVPVVFPIRLCLADVFLLALLRAAGEQNNKPVAVPPEVNSVAGAKINLYSRTPLPTVLTLEGCPPQCAPAQLLLSPQLER